MNDADDFRIKSSSGPRGVTPAVVVITPDQTRWKLSPEEAKKLGQEISDEAAKYVGEILEEGA